MLEFFKNIVLRKKQLNNDKSSPDQKVPELTRMRKRIILQAGLAGLTVVLTVVIVVSMTAAWYTNVVQTSGLIFEVEQWGVDVSANVSSSAVEAGPGDEGVISFEVSNSSDEIVSVTVSTAKISMETEMQKRLYFYVDTQQSENGETSQRVYLNSKTTHDYLVFGHGDLTLTEAYHNDAQLKWHWVYDVLGYYVLAKANGETVTVTEYLRPIEYDYDEATFAEDGTLTTVDGTTTAAEFLTALSKTDGYAGIIDTTKQINGYFPVAVDENGSGVYAYLCTYAEIEEAIDYDTALGNAAAEGQAAVYKATFTIYAENVGTEAVAVATADSLISAINSASADVIQLSSDITLPGPLTLAADSEIILDLNGKTLTIESEANTAAVTAQEGSSLVVTGGTLDGGNAALGDAFYMTGADVVLNEVILQNYDMGFYITDSSGAGQDSAVRLLDCTLSTTDSTVLIYGNGTLSEQTSKVIIDGCTITSQDSAIFGNGTAANPGKWGTDIQIIDTTITAAIAGIYHPQMEGTLNICNSSITAHTGVVIKGGTVTVTDSTISGTGTDVESPGLHTSGFRTTGDAIYVETGYNYEIYLGLNGNVTLTSNKGDPLRIYEEDATCVTFVDNRNS